MDDRHYSDARPAQSPTPTIVELVHRSDVRAQAEQFLRRWFGPAAIDVEPEADDVRPVASLWCAHRTERAPDGGPLSRTLSRPVAEAELLIVDADRAGILDGNWNVYVRCTTMARAPSYGRGGAADTCQLPGLWVDLDEKDGVTGADVERFVAALPVPVGVITYSGGGWHLWVPFTEPVYGIPAAGKLTRRWKATVERCARQVGIRADSACSGDLARVMRLAGTPNVKPERPQAIICHFIRSDWQLAIDPVDAQDDLDDEPVRPLPNFKAGPAASDRPGDQFSAQVPMLAVVEAMGGHDAWTDDDGNTYVMRPGKDRGGHGAVVYADGHAAFYSSSWVGPGTAYPHVLLALSGDVACVYNDSFRLLAHSQFGPEEAGYHMARRHVQDLGYAPGWRPQSEVDFERLVSKLGSRSTNGEADHQPEPPPAALAPVAQPEGAPQAIWADGWLDPGEMLEAWGFTRREGSGSTTGFALLAADPSGRIVAWVMPDGAVVFEQTAARVLPATTSGVRYGWHDLLALAVDTDDVLTFDDLEAARSTWARLTDPAQAFDGDDVVSKFRRIVNGVADVGHAADPPRFKWATAAEIHARPKPGTLFLPRADGACMVYDRKLSIVYGQAESGKTWLCTYMAERAVKAGHKVLWLDLEEPGRAQVADRLYSMSAPQAAEQVTCLDDTLPEIISMDYGKRTLDKAAMGELLRYVESQGFRLIVVDSYGELAGSQDLDDNRKPDLAYLKTHVLAPLMMRCALVLIDHTGHSTGAREAGSKYKRNTVDGTSLYVEQVDQFRPGHGGSARVWAMKDRHGTVKEACRYTEQWVMSGDKVPGNYHLAGTFRMAPQSSGVSLTFDKPQTLEAQPAHAPTGSPKDWQNEAGTMLDFLRSHGREATRQQVLSEAFGGSRRLFERARERLVETDKFVVERHDGGTVTFHLIRDPLNPNWR